MSRRNKNSNVDGYADGFKHDDAIITPPHQSTEKSAGGGLPVHNGGGSKSNSKINAAGESGRRGFHPLKFLWICFRSTSTLSMIVNVLWPIVPAAIAVYFALSKEHYLTIFILNYIAMVPAANTVGFAGQELARKMPKVLGVVLEITFGSVVEIILFMVLLVKGKDAAEAGGQNKNIQVIKAAILGSILANLLLCLGLCFIAGGIGRREQTFHAAVSEVGSGLMLVAGMALVIPATFATVLGVKGETMTKYGTLESASAENLVLQVSRGAAVLLLLSYFVYVIFQMVSHHGIYDEILEQDELKDRDRHKDLAKQKLTLTEALVALVIALASVALIAIALVSEIESIVVERGVSDAFMGLILVPLVEKSAEHLTAVDEAFDNQPNFALSHVLGASIQTAILNTPLVVIVGWGLGQPMDLNFKPFEAIILILAILVVGNFLRDGKSDYLEGALCTTVYIIVAVAAFFYPNE